MTDPRLKRRVVDAGDLLKGVAALAAIVVLLVGVPVLALPRLGWPLPHGIPTPAGAVDALVHRGLSFAVVIRAAAAVLWMAWAVLSSCVVVEAVAWARRREARPLRGLGGVQSLAYSLVTCAVLVVPSLSHLGAPAAAAEVFATRSAAVVMPVDRARPAVAEPPMTAEVAADAASTPSTAGVPRAYVVQRYDCLWDLAEKHLGDPLRWRELEALTAPVVQPDGGRLGDPNLIYPGWTVLFPSDAIGLDEVVETPSYAAPPAAADSPRAAQVGLDAGDPQEDVAAPPASGSESPVAAPDEVGATPTTSALSSPLSVVDGGAAVPRSSAAAPATGPATPARPAVKGPALGMSVPAAAGVGVSALVGGIFVWRMFREGLGAHRRRRRGRDLVQPEPDPVAEAVERRVRAIASVDTVFWVDATLRYATAVLAEADGGGVQGILCVRPGQLGMEVVVDPPADPVGRFESADGGRTWTLDPDIELGELQDLAWGQALVPALCSVGATADGPVLVDLEQAGVLSVEGDPGWVEGYLAGAALEIAGAPWTADTALYVLHGDERLAVRELVEVVKDEHTFLSGLGRISSLVDDDELAGIASTLAARVAPGNAEGWFPTVVVACPGTDPVVVAELAQRARPRRSGLALVGPGPLPGARWRLLIGADGHGVLEPLGLDLDARVDAEVVGTLVGRLSARAEPADVAPVVELVPELVEVAESRRASEPVGGEAAEGDEEPMEGEVRVLGPVEVTWANGDASPPDRASVLAAVVSYLGTHDDHPVPAERLQEAIWPLLDDDPSGDVRAGAVKDTTLRSTVSHARKALGKDSQGRHHLPAARVGAYQLGPRYKCDWTEFRRLVAAARTAPASEAIELYRQALDKVRGRPFEDAPAPWFTWADDSPLVSDIEVAVVRAAEELGERALEAGETELAAWAARQGLRVIPVREHLTRVRMQAAFNAGDADGIEQAHTEAVRAVRRFVDPAEPLQDETERLYQKLKRACRSGGQHQRQASEAGVR